MVIDLFHDDKLNKEFSRADNYINKRSFTLNADIEELKQHLNVNCNKPEFIKFRNEVVKAACSERDCEEFVGSYSDNHFSLELLGLEKNSKKYMVLVDFSESLDYILHLLSHCDMENIRAIPNYTEVSKAFLNGDMDALAKETYSIFIQCDPASNGILSHNAEAAASFSTASAENPSYSNRSRRMFRTLFDWSRIKTFVIALFFRNFTYFCPKVMIFRRVKRIPEVSLRGAESEKNDL